MLDGYMPVTDERPNSKAISRETCMMSSAQVGADRLGRSIGVSTIRKGIM